ncbi:NAD(P)H-binding protein [Streptomyces katsurahamanus]|uniref:NAD-dependent epimerase/dehydratase family protein n=1 Tax=Streptomyces katsurahamanus TaxID=2577098 RepID=A0ABW9P0H8_9ACTN|nr:NAD(P)H-binding protein [Streptomyces katsurahamanus]MQS39083.1 NAD-dependent epimerase/dehydratase family protein [Streptomyces katsurahamanus]
MTNTNQLVLVAGATGTVGGGIVRELLSRGHSVRALTRNPAAADLPRGAEAVRGDLTDPDSLTAALDGVDGLHLITFSGPEHTPLETGPRLMELAREAGVRRVTVLNGGGPSPLEDAVRTGGPDWTVIVPVEFMANALEWAEAVRTGDEVREPFADRVSAMVHERDIAAVAAVALTEDGHAGQEYVVTGPEALTLHDKTRALAEARGRDIRLVELTEEEAVARWREAGHPAEIIEFLLMAYGNTPLIGRTVADTVQKVTGRPARTFAQWAREHADAFRAAAG